MAGFVAEKGFGLASNSSPAGHRAGLQGLYGKTLCRVYRISLLEKVGHLE
jgi:hypothetical protein